MSARFLTVLMLSLLLALLPSACSGKPAAGVTTLAGGERGFADGQDRQAQFDTPLDVAVDEQGNLYVVDAANQRLRLITPAGQVTTVTGGDQPGAAGLVSAPIGLALGQEGFLFLADSGGMGMNPMLVRQITPDGEVITLAGSGGEGYADGPGRQASFRAPASLAVDAAGNVYVADTNNHRIRLVQPDGMVTTLAGSTGHGYVAGYADGPVGEAKFNGPRGLAVDAAGNVYVADTGNHCIRVITPDGQVTTLAGSREAGFADGAGAQALFSYPADVAIDSQGNLYVADTANHRVRKISPDGQVTTLAGSGQPGLVDGLPEQAQFRAPEGIAVDKNGNIYLADTGNHAVRKVSQP